MVKNPPVIVGVMGLIPGSEKSPEGGFSSILAWKIPWTEVLGRLPSIELQRVGHN